MAAAELLDAPNTTIAKVQPIDWELLREQALASFEIQSEAIAKEVAADTQLTVSDDKSRKVVNERRMVWVRRRTDLERTRKAAQSDAKKIVELVKEVADSFQSEFSTAENHLKDQIAEYDEKIAAAEREKADKFFNDRNNQLLHVGINLARAVVESLADADITAMIDDKIAADKARAAEAERLAAEKAEAERKAAEEREQHRIAAEQLKAEREKFAAEQAAAKLESDRLAKIEADKVAAERAELEAQRKLMEEAQRKIKEAAFAVAERERLAREAEQKKIDDQIAAAKKAEADAIEAERLRVAAEKAAIEAAERLEREKQLADDERKRQEVLRPDREKLLAFADQVAAMVDSIPLVAKPLESLRQQVAEIVTQAANAIREQVLGELSVGVEQTIDRRNRNVKKPA